MSLKAVFVSFVFFFFSYTSVLGVEYFVAPTGNDNNPGTQEQPWKSIHTAVNKPIIQPGDIIYVLPGTYTESVRVNGASGSPCGANGQYITLRGFDPNNRPILTGAIDDLRARIKIENCSYYKVENFNFSGFYNGGLHFYNSQPSGRFSYLEARNNHFENQQATELENKVDWTSTFLVMGGYHSDRSISNVVVENNTFNNTQPGSTTSYNEVLAIEGNVSKVLIEDNILRNIFYLGITLKGHEGPACAGCTYHTWQVTDVVVRGNIVDSGTRSVSGLGGIYIEGANKVLLENNQVKNIWAPIQISDEPWRETTLSFDRYIVRGNITKNSYNYGMKIGHGSCAPGYYPAGFTAYDTVYNAVVVNNVIEGSRDGHGTFMFSKAKDIAVKNNIYLSQQAGSIYSVEYAPYNDGWELNGNVMCTNNQQFTTLNTDPNANGCSITSYNSLAELQSATGFENDAILGCPSFVNSTLDNYALQSGTVGYQQAIPLTTTTGVGSNTSTVVVRDAKYFYDGWGIAGENGDRIKIGGVEARVIQVDYSTNTLTLDRSISFVNNAPVNYYYEGEAPSRGLLPDSFYENAPSSISCNPDDPTTFNSDIDGDGAVTIFDYSILVRDFGTTTTSQARIPADIDCNLSVDIFDFNFFVTHFNESR